MKLSELISYLQGIKDRITMNTQEIYGHESASEPEVFMDTFYIDEERFHYSGQHPIVEEDIYTTYDGVVVISPFRTLK